MHVPVSSARKRPFSNSRANAMMVAMVCVAAALPPGLTSAQEDRAVTTASGATPQTTYPAVVPGSPTLIPSRIRPHTVRYERPDGFMRYEMDEIDHGGRRAYRLRVYFNKLTGPPDEMYFDAETLAYVGRRHETAGYIVDVVVRDNHLRGDLAAKVGSDYSPRQYDLKYPHGGFEPALMNYWMSAMPLAEGFRASIPTIDLANGLEMGWADIEVLGREPIEIDGVEYDAWKVQSTYGPRVKTVWIDTDVPYALRMELKGYPGAWIAKPAS